jgi:signal transduction histidine kinase/DNA-binding response OmpR family regulator/streptogramin lyase
VKKLIHLFLITLHFGYCYAQTDYLMESITVADGLSQGFIDAVFEDSRGYKWLGTFNGLNRYDGYQVKRFIPDNSTNWSIKANYIYCITEDEYGLLWLGTDKGLVVMDPYSERFVHLADIDPKFPVNDVVEIDARAGRIWISDRQKMIASNVQSQIYTLAPIPELAHLIQENKLSSNIFNIQFIDIPPGFKGPARWAHVPSSKSTNILFIDQLEQLGKINPITLQATSADPQLIDYPRMGPYGLLYCSKERSGRVFQLTDDTINKCKIKCLSEFIHPSGQMPLLYFPGSPELYHLDTAISSKINIGQDFISVLRLNKPFFILDQPISSSSIIDRNENIWLGTIGFGVRKLRPKKVSFKQYLPKVGPYNFNILPDGRVWPGRDFPFKVFNPQTSKEELAPWGYWNGKNNRIFNLLISRSGDWWLVNCKNDQLFIKKKEYQTGQWEDIPVSLPYLDSGTIPIFEDKNGNIWISAIHGKIARISPIDNQTEYWSFDADFPKPQQGSVLQSSCIVEDSQGILWLGSNQGLVRIEHPEATPIFTVWHNYGPKGVLFKNERISSICPDPDQQHLIWMSTLGGGLHCFDSQKEISIIYNENDGLANNVVYGVLPDTFGYLWLSTNRGLSRFDRQNKTFYNLSSDDKRLGIEFNTDAFRILPSGELAFGGLNGLFLVRPLQEKQGKQANLVAITAIKINGNLLNPAVEASFIHFTNQNEVSLILPFNKNSITFEFAALQTSNPASANFRYRLLGLDPQWINAGSQRIANFTLIPPGQYTLEVQSVNAKEIWGDAPITKLFVTITPPWYRSWFAWICYAGVIVGLFYAYLIYERRYLALEYKEKTRRIEIERLKSLDDFKNRFFGSISHEFKTPLTIILGHAKRLTTNNGQQDITQHAEAILHQGQSLLEMVTQMVDVTKLDKESIQLNWQNGDITDYLRYLVESLRALANFKNIQLDVLSAVPHLQMDFDPLRLKYIINNLLTNAIRHTPTGGMVRISIQLEQPEQLAITVTDTGEGIAPEELPFIFDRYFQGSSNVKQDEPQFGIGLTFVKDLVTLFGGTVSVISTLGSGTQFKILLPIKQEAVQKNIHLPEFIRENTDKEAQNSTSSKNLPLLLIIEDNVFISNYLRDTLAPHFQLEFAIDGNAGYESALNLVPDLILTDIMMPGIDGYELTHKLKNAVPTSHIPIVMLSARSGLSDRIIGHQSGANVYIGKPFDEEELILTLNNLFQLQHHWRERYADLSAHPMDKNTPLPVNIPDQEPSTIQQTDAFMYRLYAIFEKKYTNEDYDLLQFCTDIEMSKSQLQRKLTALSDQSAMQLLRAYRLQKAYKILSADPNKNVKEVCFEVGFKDASHFSRLFSKTFNIAPSEVKKAD